MFQQTKGECLRPQIATLNEGRGQHLKYMPYVFTENGFYASSKSPSTSLILFSLFHTVCLGQLVREVI